MTPATILPRRGLSARMLVLTCWYATGEMMAAHWAKIGLTPNASRPLSSGRDAAVRL